MNLLKKRKERKKTLALVRKVEDVEAAEGCFPCEERQESKPDINHLSGEKKEGLTVNGTKYVVTREDVLYLGFRIGQRKCALKWLSSSYAKQFYSWHTGCCEVLPGAHWLVPPFCSRLLRCDLPLE